MHTCISVDRCTAGVRAEAYRQEEVEEMQLNHRRHVMKTKLSWFDRMMMGITFAEANLPEVGRELMGGGVSKDKKQKGCEKCDLGLGEGHDLHAKGAKA
jgi:hypothetical protein